MSSSIETTRLATSTPLPQSVSLILVTVDYSKHARSDPESIRRFLNSYDQYVTGFIARAKQLGSNMAGPEGTRPVDLKFCVDIEYLTSFIALGLIPSVTFVHPH